MNFKKSVILTFLVTIIFLNGCGRDVPIYEYETNFDTVILDGTEYALQRLSYDGAVYISEPEQLIDPETYDAMKLGKLIGKTEDGMRIYEVKNDSKRIAMKGFMYPAEFYKLAE